MPHDEDAAFPHIVVTPDDDDDIVIQAGASTSTPSKDPADTSIDDATKLDGSSVSLNTQKTPTEPVEDKTSGEKSHAPSSDGYPTDKTSQDVSTDNAKNTTETSAKKVSNKVSKEDKKEDNYHETTLEDIENTKMSTTQKIIIVLAIIVIIVFIIYYFVR